MSGLSQHFLTRRIAEAWPTSAWSDSHVVLAVSGGPDSVAMVRAVLELKDSAGGSGRLFAAHLNHGLRPADSDADQTWLEELCERLNLPLEVGRANVSAIAAAAGDGLEAAARTARYDFLRQTAEMLGARFVAVAHTADDQVETVLHRILRGTGLAGLAAMPGGRPLSPSVALVRPMLGVRRIDVLDFLQSIGQDYRIDVSNTDRRWTRNRLRHELLPVLRENYNPNVDDALLRLAAQARETQLVVAELADALVRECVSVPSAPQPQSGTAACRLEIQCRPLVKTPAIIVREVCRTAWQQANWPMQAMGFDDWVLLSDLIHGKHDAPANLAGNVRAQRVGETLILERMTGAEF